MARKLLIKKYSEGVFGHKDSEIPLEFFVSKFFIDIDANFFQIKEGNGGSGARRFQYLFTDVSIQVGNGVIETYNSKQALFDRLLAIRYTGMIDYIPEGGEVTSITVNGDNYLPDGNGLVNLGTIEAGATFIVDGDNTTVTGSGTEIDPYQISAEGGGGSQNLQQTLENGNTALGVGMELIEDGTDPFSPVGGYIKITDQFGNYNNITGSGFGVQEFGTAQNTAYSFNGFSNLSETGNTQVLFETPTDYTGTWIFPDLATGTDRVAGEQWVIDQGYSTGGGGATNLSYTPGPTDGTVNSDTGTDATIPLTDGTNAGLFSPSEKTKLAGIATGATANTGTVTSVTGVSGETTVASGTTTPVIGIASAYTTARDAVANAKVENNLTASTTVAPSKTAVNTGLAGKLNTPTGTANAGTFLRGDNVYVDITTRVQANIIGANNGTGAALTATTMQRNAFWDLQLQIDNLLTNVPFSAINTSTVALTKAALNTAYPNVPVGFTVQAKDVTTGAMVYIKNSEAGTSDVWLSINATITP